MSYYGDAQWSGPAGQAGWDHQTPPARSGASSAVPREESAAAFSAQIEEVDKAIDNLVKSGKMFGMPPNRGPRMGPNVGPRAHAMSDHGDSRGGHPPSNLQNFYASQRHQSSRGSNEAEQMIQAKRRMAAQRERELRNYHQEQQFNRTVLAEISASNYGNTAKPDRALSPGNMSEEDRRELIARQRSALYGEGPFAETGGYVDETGTPRPGIPTHHHGGGGSGGGGGGSGGPGATASLRGHSPLAYEYGRTPPAEGASGDGPSGSQSAGQNQRSRANSTASPQSNTAGSKGGVFDAPAAQQSSRTSNSSPGGSPGTKAGPGGNAVAPIGTRPSGTPTNPQGGSAANPALNKRSTTPLHSPLSHGFSAPSNIETTTTAATTGASNPSSAAPDSGMNHPWGARPGVWGNGKSGLGGVQASVWG